jgi:type II secretory ATPase GspE/PulE/Tfp pilus assembly ATPase PilB-like protein
VNLIAAQRLVRRVCAHCKTDVTKDIHSQSLVEAGFEPGEKIRQGITSIEEVLRETVR